MIDSLTACGLQLELAWEQPEANIASVDRWMASKPEGMNLMVLPEMWSTGFTMNPEAWAEDATHGIGLAAMKRWASESNALVCGSLCVADGPLFRNRHYAVRPDGSFVHYDKRHAFALANEHLHYAPGMERVVVEWMGWKLLLLTCYDLRFPVFSRNLKQSPFDGIICVANWPEVRSEAWAVLLKARAIENQCFMIGANRLGHDGNGIAHNGRSALIDPFGSSSESLHSGWYSAQWLYIAFK